MEDSTWFSEHLTLKFVHSTVATQLYLQATIQLFDQNWVTTFFVAPGLLKEAESLEYALEHLSIGIVQALTTQSFRRVLCVCSGKTLITVIPQSQRLLVAWIKVIAGVRPMGGGRQDLQTCWGSWWMPHML